MIKRSKLGAFIILDGRVYSAAIQDPIEINKVCDLCDLSDQCDVGITPNQGRTLCSIFNLNSEEFFAECCPTPEISVLRIAMDQNIIECCEALSSVQLAL